MATVPADHGAPTVEYGMHALWCYICVFPKIQVKKDVRIIGVLLRYMCYSVFESNIMHVSFKLKF